MNTTKAGSRIPNVSRWNRRSHSGLVRITRLPTRALFGAIGDSAPDRWGRVLMRRAERIRAEREGRAPRAVREIDCLLLVDDEARQGALRFAEREGGPFLAGHTETQDPAVPRASASALRRRTCFERQRERRRPAAAARAWLIAWRRPSQSIGAGPRTAISRSRSFRAKATTREPCCGRPLR